VRDAVERITDQWHVLAEHLSAEELQRLSDRRDELPILR
jgi:hypothetical protein